MPLFKRQRGGVTSSQIVLADMNVDLIDTDLSFEDARKFYKINDLAIRYGDNPDFSVLIR